MDCNITTNYAMELKRMCAAHHACHGCPLRGDKNCLHATAINQSRIDTVQNWSDAHPTYTINNEFVVYNNTEPYTSTDWSTTTDTNSVQFNPLPIEKTTKEIE